MNVQNRNKDGNKNKLPLIIGAIVLFVIIAVILAILLSKCGDGKDETGASASSGPVTDTSGSGAVSGAASADPDEKPVHVHAFGDWTVLSEPDCLTPGSRERTCSECGGKQTEEISPLGHDVHNNECVRCGKKAELESFTLKTDRENPDAVMVEQCFATGPDVLIPDVFDGKPVVRVRYESFAGNENVKYVSIPDSVVVVESWALAYMPNLEFVRIGKNVADLDRTFRFYTDNLRRMYVEPGNERYHSYCNCIIETADKALISGCGGSVLPDDGSVTVIANGAFSNVKNLTGLAVPGTVTKFEDYSMNNCEGLLSLYLPDSVVEIGDYAFEGCKGLRSLRLPAKIEKYGVGWFRGCESLKEVVFPDAVTDTGVSCFEDCTSLESVGLPEGIERIGNYTFRNCTALENVVLPQSLTKLGDAFAGCTELRKLVIPDGVEAPGVSVISHCSSLTEIVLPKDMTSIPYHFFGDCSSLESVVLPDKVTQIEYNAFMRCTNLKSVVFPASLRYIQYDIFEDCPSLETVYYAGSEKDWSSISINSSNEILNKARIVYNYKG